MITTHTHIHIGTSGWTYDDWQGAFYPDDIKSADRLARCVRKLVFPAKIR